MSILTAQLGMIRTAITAAGSTFPKGVAQALADSDTIAQASATFAAPSADQVADIIAACVLRGDDPADDEQVRHMTTAQAIASPSGGYRMQVGEAADRRVVAALTEAADDILDVLAESADKAGDKLADAFRLIGDNDLGDSQLILSLGSDAARAWAEAREAQHQLRTIDRAWGSLAELTGFASASDHPTLRLADLALEAFEKVGRKAEPWDIVRAGGTIDLADGNTIRQRVERINTERQQRQDGHAAAAQAAAARPY